MATEERTCIWTIDEAFEWSMWEGACGVTWSFTDGGPEDNECNYCPKCGGKMIVVRRREAASAATNC